MVSIHHSSNEDFFTNLTTLFTSHHTRTHGSVFLTQKPFLSSTSTAAQTADPSEPPQNIPVLIRATTEAPKANTTFTPTPTQPFPPKSLKDKTKLSTIVQPEDLDTFFLKYAEICKGGMQQGLKKRDRKKRDKKKKKGKSKVEKV